MAESAYVAPNAVVCGDVVIGEDSRILFGAVLTAEQGSIQVGSSSTIVEPERTVPIGWSAVGDPARLFPPDHHDELWPIQRELDFPGTVFGIPRDEATMARVAERYAELFGAHRDDRLVEG